MTDESQKPRRLPLYFYKGSTITGIVLIIVFAIAAVFLLAYGKRLQTFLGTAALPTVGARYTLNPQTTSVTAGQNFTVAVMLNTGTDAGGAANKALTAGAYLTFDVTKLKVISVDQPTPATFDYIVEANKDQAGSTTETDRYDNTTGKINISALKTSPGIGGSAVVVANITFQAKSVTGTTNLNFDFTTARASNSEVVVWDAAANAPGDILDGVTNGTFTINPPAPSGSSTVTYTDADATAGNEAYNNSRSGSTLKFTYTAVTNATSYSYRVLEVLAGGSTSQIKASTAITATPGQTTTVTGLTLLNGHKYEIEVTASNGAGSTVGLSTMVTTRSGDVNRDGSVGFADFQAFATHYNKAYTNTSADMSDINGDGTVNFNDLSYIAQDYGQTL